MNDDKDAKIEYITEAVESTGSQAYPANLTPVFVVREQTALSLIGLILALPFPVLIIILWLTLNVIKQQNQGLGEGTMNAVFLYLLQFFVVPVLSLVSIIIASIVTMKSKEIAKKIGYVTFGITAVGFIILGLFLNRP
jgi:hypothetical protein